MTKTSKEEADFFRYFDDVQITQVEQETWERYMVPLSRYTTNKGE